MISGVDRVFSKRQSTRNFILPPFGVGDGLVAQRQRLGLNWSVDHLPAIQSGSAFGCPHLPANCVSFQQYGEARLFEVTITRQRFGDAVPPHDLKRDAIGKRPLLVSAFSVEFDSLIEELLTRRHDSAGGIGSKRLQQGKEIRPQGGR